LLVGVVLVDQDGSYGELLNFVDVASMVSGMRKAACGFCGEKVDLIVFK
jgi:hypothetical protein